MLSTKALLLCTALVVAYAAAASNPIPIINYKDSSATSSSSDGDGEPLFLTKYLDDPSTGRSKAEVDVGWDYESYAGYFTCNASTGSNHFFWFFPAQNGDKDAPVLLWLQGGPGGASMFGLFSENGPFSVATNYTLLPREYNWNYNYSMLYIDNPVGAGFSFTTSTEGYVTNEDEVAEDMYSTLTQFFTIFDDYADNDFYVTGESYAGKYVPSIAYYIHQQNLLNPSVPINLVGISIGDGAMSPLDQMTSYAWFLNDVGLTSTAQSEFIEEVFDNPTRELIEAGDVVAAFHLFDSFLNGDFTSPTYFQNITGLTDYFNLLNPIYPPNPYPEYLNLTATRKGIHVGQNVYWDYNQTVEYYLIDDWMVGVTEKLPTLMDNYKVLMYNGQLDLILGRALAEPFYRSIEWSGQDDYLNATHQIWKLDDGTVAGYVQQAGNYSVATVLAAGHMVPADQPQAATDMITRFVDSLPWSSNPACC